MKGLIQTPLEGRSTIGFPSCSFGDEQLADSPVHFIHVGGCCLSLILALGSLVLHKLKLAILIGPRSKLEAREIDMTVMVWSLKCPMETISAERVHTASLKWLCVTDIPGQILEAVLSLLPPEYPELKLSSGTYPTWSSRRSSNPSRALCLYHSCRQLFYDTFLSKADLTVVQAERLSKCKLYLFLEDQWKKHIYQWQKLQEKQNMAFLIWIWFVPSVFVAFMSIQKNTSLWPKKQTNKTELVRLNLCGLQQPYQIPITSQYLK